MDWLEISLTVDGEMAEAVAEVLSRYAPNGVVAEQGVRHRDDRDLGAPDGPITVRAYLAADEQLTLTRIYEELRGSGFDGSYDAVRRYAKSWRKERGAMTPAGDCGIHRHAHASTGRGPDHRRWLAQGSRARADRRRGSRPSPRHPPPTQSSPRPRAGWAAAEGARIQDCRK